MMEENKSMTAFDLLMAGQETLEEAKAKQSQETNQRIEFMRFKNDGTYPVRILPLAPIIDADGKALPPERKGYEYPLRSYIMKISSGDANGKTKVDYVNVCNAKYAFKDRLENDLIDLYVSRACELYSSDTALCKKLRDNSFNGGLKWDAKRCMYIIDLQNPGEGIKILQLTYAQYKDLEERKLALWGKINKNGKSKPCPISSLSCAYPTEIIRKTENGKTAYSFNIDTVSEPEGLTEEMAQKLLEAPRLPEIVYRYTRFHLEATVAFLRQVDEKYQIEVMQDEAIQNCIEQIKMLLPANDQSHYTLGHNPDKEIQVSSVSIDSLWQTYNELVDSSLDDKSAEGQELRTSIKEFIENEDLDIQVTRNKSNEDLLQEIDSVLDSTAESCQKIDEVPAPSQEDDEEDPIPVPRQRAPRPERTRR